MDKITFNISFNKDEYKTKENFKILESIKGVEKSKDEYNFGDHKITFNNFTDMRNFLHELEQKTDYNATVIVSFDEPNLFIEMDTYL